MRNKEDICHIVQRKRATISLSYMKMFDLPKEAFKETLNLC